MGEVVKLTELKNTYYFIRHGETDWNKEKRLMGQKNIPLNEIGREQARLLTIPERVDHVYSSTLKRAYETAKVIFPNQAIVTDSRLMEKNSGQAEGLLLEDVKNTFPEIWSLWTLEDVEEIMIHSKFPDGESDLEVAQRMSLLLHDLESLYKDSVVALVSHSGIYRVIMYLLGAPKEVIFGQKVGNSQVDKLKVFR